MSVQALIVFPEYMYPLNGGAKVAINGYIAALRDLHASIDLICFDTGPIEMNRSWFREVLTLPKPRKLRPGAILLSMLRNDSYLFRRFTSSAIKKVVENFVSTRQYDLVLVAHAYMTGVLTDEFLGKNRDRLLISAELLEGQGLNRKAALEKSFLKRAFWRQQATLTEAAELKALQNSRMCLFYSSDESSLYDRETGSDNGKHVGLGLNLDNYCVRVRAKHDRKQIAFYGDFAWYPNRDALSYLLKDIWPSILAVRPDSVLTIAGRRPPDWVYEYSADSVRILGAVPDMLAVISDSDVVLAPIRIGGGTRLKILEAMALGRPVIASPEALEGVAARVGEAVICARTPDEYAEGVSRLLSNDEAWTHISDAAREYIGMSHDYRLSIGSVLRELGLRAAA